MEASPAASCSPDLFLGSELWGNVGFSKAGMLLGQTLGS